VSAASPPAASSAAAAPNQIEDFISGILVPAGPEEVEAVQVFSRRLVEEFGYPKDHIQTRPQFMVREAPSGKDKWPVDISVFGGPNHAYNNIWMLVECKRPTVKDGRKQLEIYMNLTTAQVGVWFNGNQHLYLRKRVLPDGTTTIEPLHALPRFGQTLSDVGHLLRKDLRPPTNLKALFKDIRNRLVPMALGVTRDETIAREFINILFCKIWDELNTNLTDTVQFFAGDESSASVKARIQGLFTSKVRGAYDDVLDATDTITLDPDSVAYVVGALQDIAITEAPRDAIGEAFEVFIGPALKGPQGQFFTPRNVVKMMVEIIDPACGSGGFLIVALEHVWAKLEAEAPKKGWTEGTLQKMKAEAAQKFFRGIEKDSFLARVTKAYMAVIGDGRGFIFTEDSLRPMKDWPERVREAIKPEQFSYVFTNPPFGSKIKVEGEQILGQYPLGHTWKRDSSGWTKTTTIPESRPPQVLFIDRCLELLKPGGKLAIVLPESLFGNPSHGYVAKYLADNVKITGLVSMPEDLFQPWTHAKACVLFAEKVTPPADYPVRMAAVKWCGHDSRGNPIPYDDVPKVAPKFRSLAVGGKSVSKGAHDRLGFTRMLSRIQNNIFIPKYYDPEIESDLRGLSATHDLLIMGDLAATGIVTWSTGDEVGKLSYGTGPIPFIRTSDLANWELKLDPKQGVSEAIYQRYAATQDVQAADILMVRDGTYLIGTSAMLTEYDTQILFQSHLYKIRVLKPNELDPYLLLAVLNSPIVKRQMRAKQFTQDIIDSLGRRISELVLPVPKDEQVRTKIADQTREIVETRAALRTKARQVGLLVMGDVQEAEEQEALAEIV
jgi:type I restriction enzyme M protein